jgi:glycosyltransferase involved in cell wall biosynthesis
MNSNRISVVIPAYNAAATIARAIHSVLKQCTPVDEIIVVDDGSGDQTAAIVHELIATAPCFIQLIQQPNANAASARNRGIEAARGDWIAFLDADDYWEQEKIQQQMQVLKQHPQVSVIGGNFYSEIPHGTRTLNRIPRTDLCNIPLRLSGNEAFLFGTLLWTGTVMIRRSLLNRERFVSGLEPAEDRDLWVRLVQQETVYLDSQPLATAVLEPNSISRSDIAKDCTQMLRVIERHRSMLSFSHRLVWKSYVRYRWAAIDPAPSTSMPLLFRSFINWPLPLWPMPAMKSLGRLKRLLHLIRTSIVRQPVLIKES